MSEMNFKALLDAVDPYVDEGGDIDPRVQRFLSEELARYNEIIKGMVLTPSEETTETVDKQPNALALIVEQLRACGYECEAGRLEDNADFRLLEQMATH